MKKILRIFETVEKIILSVPFIFLSFAIVTDIVRRRVFFSSFTWLEECSRYILIFATFLGAAIAVSMDKHPKMTALQNVLGAKVSKWLILLADVISMALVGYLAYFAFSQVSNQMNMGTITSSMGIPLWTAYAIIPLSMVGMTIRFALLIRKDIRVIQGKEELDTMDAELKEALADLEELEGKQQEGGEGQ